MEQSLPIMSKALSALRHSLLLPSRAYSSYAQMSHSDQGETGTHSLFYSLPQDALGESIPLTHSNAYSDTSQLLFDGHDLQEESMAASASMAVSDYEESPKPSAIYLDTPLLPTSPCTSGKALLSESLLPTTAAIPPKRTTPVIDRKYKDPLFGILYLLALGVYLITGGVVLGTTDSHALDRVARGSTFRVISDSAGLLSMMVAATFIVGAGWFFVLHRCTKAIVWGTVVCVPVVLVGLFLWTLVESFQSYYYYDSQPSSQDTSLTFLSFVPLAVGLVYVKMVLSGRHRIQKTIAVIEFACDLLQSNPGILIVSLILLCVFVGFSALWLVLFSRLWLLGYVQKTSQPGKFKRRKEKKRPRTHGRTLAIWIVHDHVTLLVVFYVFIYMWTAAVLINMQRFALSAITAQWYFHRHEPTLTNGEVWKSSLLRGSTTSLGTLAVGGLILTLVQAMHLLTQYLKKYVKKSRPFVWIVSIVLAYLEALVSQINHYTISLSGITGESFYGSARSGTRMFRRNLLSGLLGDLLTKLILYVGAVVISFISGLGTYVFATHHLHSQGYIIGMMAAIVPMYIAQFFSYTMMSIIDAAFLCYAIDLDTGMVHMSSAHTVFSGFD
ncbi:plasma-membrane choline transporter-domain-containing protein [Spinellus fusiger]|nr:plasma-membrane choline transporter-domain-containing protein [Spinellus fusiger]